MKRRSSQEHDEEIARAQAEERREKLLAELRAHEAAAREPAPAPPSVTESNEVEGAPDEAGLQPVADEAAEETVD